MNDDFYKVYIQDYLKEYHCSRFLKHPAIYNYIAYIAFFLGAISLVIYELLVDTQSLWGVSGYVLAILFVIVLSMLLWKKLQLNMIKNFKQEYPGVLPNTKYSVLNWFQIDETMDELKSFLIQLAGDEWEANQRICGNDTLFDYHLRAFVQRRLKYWSLSSTSLGLLVFSFIIKRLFEQILNIDIGIEFFVNISNWFSAYVLGLRSGNPEILHQTFTVIIAIPILITVLYFYFKLPRYLKTLTIQIKFKDLFQITKNECEKNYFKNNASR